MSYEQAGVENAHPHRFRHTFAVEYLRNRKDAMAQFTLQEILGHSDMSMVRRYVRLVEADVQAAHRESSPVYKWAL